jgi:hypothetical protein
MSGISKGVGAYDKSLFQDWVIRKIGIPLLQIKDFPTQAIPNSNFGIVHTTGTVTRDSTAFGWGGMEGGGSSLSLVTQALNGDTTEVKCQFGNNFRKGDRISLEHKWWHNNTSGSTKEYMGIESRDFTGPFIWQEKIQWDNVSKEYKFESAAGVWSSFPASVGGPIVTRDHKLDTAAGTPLGWVRLVIDPINRLKIAVETDARVATITPTGQLAYTTGCRVIDYSILAGTPGIYPPLINSGASTDDNILIFVQNVASGANAEVMGTCDWCMSLIPQGVQAY